jgi:predicted ester cyclase
MDNEALVRRAIEAIWNRDELGVADDLFSHDYVNHDGLIPDLVRGPEAIKVSVALYRIAFPGFYITVEELSTDGEAVVIHWTARRKTPGSADGADIADQTLLTGITRSRLSAGKVVATWTEWDQAQVLRNLGVTFE